MPPRIGPAPLSPAERQARRREARKAYVAALERAVVDAAQEAARATNGVNKNCWIRPHAETIARARGAQAQHGGE